MATFSNLLVSLAGPVVKKALVSLGVGAVTYAGLQAAASSAVSAAQTAFGGVGAGPAAILAMSGIFTAMSIIAGGIMAGITMVAVKRLQMLT